MMYRESLRITGGEFSLDEERERMKQVTNDYMCQNTFMFSVVMAFC